MKSQRKVMAMVLVVLLLSVCMAGCKKADSETSSNKKSKDKVIIAGIYKSGDQQWFIGEGKAAEKKCKELGADEFMYIDVKLDPDLYLQAIDNAISQNVAGILTCPPDQKLSKVVVQKCKDAGIPVVACDDALLGDDGKMIAPYVGIDALAIGKACGKWAADYAKNNNMIGEDAGLLLLAADTVTSCVPRTDGALESWKEAYPDWPDQRIWRVDYTGPQDEAYDQAAATFTAHPEIKKWVIMAINDEGAAGATRALEAVELDKDAVVVGVGGYLAKLEFKKEGGSAFKATAFINYEDIGSYSADNLMTSINEGTDIPMDTRTPAVMITAENYKEIMKDQAD